MSKKWLRNVTPKSEGKITYEDQGENGTKLHVAGKVVKKDFLPKSMLKQSNKEG